MTTTVATQVAVILETLLRMLRQEPGADTDAISALDAITDGQNPFEMTVNDWHALLQPVSV